jgi:hypothetical protein
MPRVGLGTAHDGVLLVTVCVAYAHGGAYGYGRALVRGKRASWCQQEFASTAQGSLCGGMGKSQLGGEDPLPEHERVMLSPGSWRVGSGQRC